MVKAILFDLDGTLTNTDPLHYQTWKEILQAYDLTIDPSFYQKFFSGRLNPDIIRDLLPHLSPEAGAKLSNHKEATFRQRAQKLQPLPGLLDVIAFGKQRSLKQAVVTNAPRLNAEFMLHALELSDRFDLVVLAEELPIAKPDPLPYRHALDQLGVAPKDAIAFEDSPSGIRSAIAAGILTIGVATTHDPDKLYQLGAKLVITDFTDARLQDLLGITPDLNASAAAIAP